jgi:hypothetical protein
MALNGLQLLFNYEIIPCSEVKNILRVFSIQANSGRSESQLKLLQILLQMANFVSKEYNILYCFTESNICLLLTIPFQLCDIRNQTSVSSTAFATSRQIIGIIGQVMILKGSIDPKDPSILCCRALVNDLTLFLKGEVSRMVVHTYKSSTLQVPLENG